MIKIGLHSGGILTVDPIDVSQVAIEDIAYGLSYVTRFGGQAGQYSVAEHCVHLANYWLGITSSVASPVLSRGVRACLIHDAPESLGVGDVNRFIKRRYAQTLRDFDAELTYALWAKFGLGSWDECHDAIAPLDEQLGMLESDAFGFPFETGKCDYEYTFEPQLWSPDHAEYRWLTLWSAYA